MLNIETYLPNSTSHVTHFQIILSRMSASGSPLLMVPTLKLNNRHQMWLSRFFLCKVTKLLHKSQSQFLFVILLSSKLKDNSAITFEDRLVLIPFF